MTHHHNTPPDTTRRSLAGVPSTVDGLAGRRAAVGAKPKRSIFQWILLIAILILPW
jgi:hypothetical protein